MMDHRDGSTGSFSANRQATPHNDKLVIGWREYVNAPKWKIRGIAAKIDTGARTSAIDVADIEEIDRDRVRFHVVLSRNHRSRRVQIEAKIRRRTRVRSSLGHVESRLVVSTLLEIGSVTRRIELGLVCRKSMRCRMLLGRTAIEDGFLVDAGRIYLLGRRKRSKAKSAAGRRRLSTAKGRQE